MYVWSKEIYKPLARQIVGKDIKFNTINAVKPLGQSLLDDI